MKEDVAQWSYTGKHFGYNSYGMKGEALAALKELSEMEIMSCTEDSTGTLVKKFCGTNDIYKVYDTDRSKSGTKVMIKNLFHNVPVRQASTRSILELNLIKEFIKNMSVLHHQVSWNLIDSATKMKNVIKLDLESSVAARFASYHGEHVLNRMKVSNFEGN